MGLDAAAADQVWWAYLHAGMNALGAMPTHATAVMERFFDEAGDMHLVIHSPRGSRLNRAWGLALRKRFCRNFNFELQAAANEDTLVLSLGQTHSFPLADVWRYLNRTSVREVLVQALLDAPMFQTRWRWNASCALAVLRQRGGKRVAPYLQRMQSEDLLSLVFPDQLACQENLSGEREIPDHPLVTQAIGDCLSEAMDIAQLESLLEEMDRGVVTLVARDLREPSPFAQEIINARPYAFLDDAPLEERRTQAIRNRRWVTPEEAREFGALDAAAIAQVRAEALPRVEDADELHDALELLTFIDEVEGLRAGWGELFAALAGQGRATRLTLPATGAGPHGGTLDRRRTAAPVAGPWSIRCAPNRRCSSRRRWRSGCGGAKRRCARWCAAAWRRPARSAPPPWHGRSACRGREAELALLALETEGAVLRGEFTGSGGEEWCERRLLARIHRYTPWAACAARSSRWRSTITCDFCSTGRWSPPSPGTAPARRPRVRKRCSPSCTSSPDTRPPRRPGRSGSCRRGCPAMTRLGSTCCAPAATWHGRGCGRRTGIGRAAAAVRWPAAPSRC